LGDEVSSSFLILRIVRFTELNLGRCAVAEVVDYKIYNNMKYCKIDLQIKEVFKINVLIYVESEHKTARVFKSGCSIAFSFNSLIALYTSTFAQSGT